MTNIDHTYEKSSPRKCSAPEMKFARQFSNELAMRWDEFVECRTRTRTMRTFFETHVFEPDMMSAIDLGAGSGCELRWMASRFEHFVANEIDEGLRKELRVLQGETGSNFEIANANWLTLGKSELGMFDLAFLVGNSLCMLKDEREELRALKNFHSILNPGARFVIDQRNFDYILDNKEQILGGNFHYAAKVVYCGKKIIGRPTAITDKKIEFSYFDLTGRVVGKLAFFPTRFATLMHLLQEAGFEIENVYSDLRPGVDTNSDFATFVCRAR